MPQNESILNSESLDFLEQVKKGKPRKFVMIYKGSEIVSLVVYKKGSFEKYKKEAKKSGKGKIVHGVIDGKGPNINFRLARSDGYDEQPLRTQILKKFLADNTDHKFKPMFEIVDSTQLVLDDEDPLVQRFMSLQERVMAAMESDQAEQIGRLCQEIGVHFDADQSDEAAQKLQTLENLLNQVDGQETSQATSTPTTSDPAAELKAFGERLKVLKVQADEAISAGVSISADAKRLLGEAAAFGKDRDFVSANVVLDDLKKLLDNTQWRVELENKGQVRSLEDIKAELEPKLKAIWSKQSQKSVDSLTKLNKAFQSRAGQHYVDASTAVTNVLNKLTNAPLDPDDVNQMRQYLDNDASVSILDESVKFKKSLMTVLDGVEQAYEIASNKS